MPSQHKVPIVLVTDIAYIPGLLAFLMSLEVNSGLPADQEIIVLEVEQLNNQEREIIKRFNYKISCLDVRELGNAKDFKLSFFDLADIAPFPFTYFWFRRTFVKFFLFRMTDYEKIIFMDVDMLCMDDITEVVDFRPLAAAPEFGRDDPLPVKELGRNLSFCTGFMVLEPQEDDYQGILGTLRSKGPELLKKFPTGDQAIINHYFYKHKPTAVNLVDQKWGITNRMTTSAPKLMEERPKLLHYLGIKPWMGDGSHELKLDKLWWHYFVLAGRKIGGKAFEDKLER
jgi:lipopolysaccharide biosynthesis glycosyltransferase